MSKMKVAASQQTCPECEATKKKVARKDKIIHLLKHLLQVKDKHYEDTVNKNGLALRYKGQDDCEALRKELLNIASQCNSLVEQQQVYRRKIEEVNSSMEKQTGFADLLKFQNDQLCAAKISLEKEVLDLKDSIKTLEKKSSLSFSIKTNKKRLENLIDESSSSPSSPSSEHQEASSVSFVDEVSPTEGILTPASSVTSSVQAPDGSSSPSLAWPNSESGPESESPPQSPSPSLEEINNPVESTPPLSLDVIDCSMTGTSSTNHPETVLNDEHSLFAVSVFDSTVDSVIEIDPAINPSVAYSKYGNSSTIANICTSEGVGFVNNLVASEPKEITKADSCLTVDCSKTELSFGLSQDSIMLDSVDYKAIMGSSFSSSVFDDVLNESNAGSSVPPLNDSPHVKKGPADHSSSLTSDLNLSSVRTIFSEVNSLRQSKDEFKSSVDEITSKPEDRSGSHFSDRNILVIEASLKSKGSFEQFSTNEKTASKSPIKNSDTERRLNAMNNGGQTSQLVSNAQSVDCKDVTSSQSDADCELPMEISSPHGKSPNTSEQLSIITCSDEGMFEEVAAKVNKNINSNICHKSQKPHESGDVSAVEESESSNLEEFDNSDFKGFEDRDSTIFDQFVLFLAARQTGFKDVIICISSNEASDSPAVCEALHRSSIQHIIDCSEKPNNNSVEIQNTSTEVTLPNLCDGNLSGNDRSKCCSIKEEKKGDDEKFVRTPSVSPTLEVLDFTFDQLPSLISPIKSLVKEKTEHRNDITVNNGVSICKDHLHDQPVKSKLTRTLFSTDTTIDEEDNTSCTSPTKNLAIANPTEDDTCREITPAEYSSSDVSIVADDSSDKIIIEEVSKPSISPNIKERYRKHRRPIDLSCIGTISDSSSDDDVDEPILMKSKHSVVDISLESNCNENNVIPSKQVAVGNDSHLSPSTDSILRNTSQSVDNLTKGENPNIDVLADDIPETSYYPSCAIDNTLRASSTNNKDASLETTPSGFSIFDTSIPTDGNYDEANVEEELPSSSSPNDKYNDPRREPESPVPINASCIDSTSHDGSEHSVTDEHVLIEPKLPTNNSSLENNFNEDEVKSTKLVSVENNRCLNFSNCDNSQKSVNDSSANDSLETSQLNSTPVVSKSPETQMAQTIHLDSSDILHLETQLPKQKSTQASFNSDATDCTADSHSSPSSSVRNVSIANLSEHKDTYHETTPAVHSIFDTSVEVRCNRTDIEEESNISTTVSPEKLNVSHTDPTSPVDVHYVETVSDSDSDDNVPSEPVLIEPNPSTHISSLENKFNEGEAIFSEPVTVESNESLNASNDSNSQNSVIVSSVNDSLESSQVNLAPLNESNTVSPEALRLQKLNRRCRTLRSPDDSCIDTTSNSSFEDDVTTIQPVLIEMKHSTVSISQKHLYNEGSLISPKQSTTDTDSQSSTLNDSFFHSSPSITDNQKTIESPDPNIDLSASDDSSSGCSNRLKIKPTQRNLVASNESDTKSPKKPRINKRARTVHGDSPEIPQPKTRRFTRSRANITSQLTDASGNNVTCDASEASRRITRSASKSVNSVKVRRTSRTVVCKTKLKERISDSVVSASSDEGESGNFHQSVTSKLPRSSPILLQEKSPLKHENKEPSSHDISLSAEVVDSSESMISHAVSVDSNLKRNELVSNAESNFSRISFKPKVSSSTSILSNSKMFNTQGYPSFSDLKPVIEDETVKETHGNSGRLPTFTFGEEARASSPGWSSKPHSEFDDLIVGQLCWSIQLLSLTSSHSDIFGHFPNKKGTNKFIHRRSRRNRKESVDEMKSASSTRELNYSEVDNSIIVEIKQENSPFSFKVSMPKGGSDSIGPVLNSLHTLLQETTSSNDMGLINPRQNQFAERIPNCSGSVSENFNLHENYLLKPPPFIPCSFANKPNSFKTENQGQTPCQIDSSVFSTSASNYCPSTTVNTNLLKMTNDQSYRNYRSYSNCQRIAQSTFHFQSNSVSSSETLESCDENRSVLFGSTFANECFKNSRLVPSTSLNARTNQRLGEISIEGSADTEEPVRSTTRGVILKPSVLSCKDTFKNCEIGSRLQFSNMNEQGINRNLKIASTVNKSESSRKEANLETVAELCTNAPSLIDVSKLKPGRSSTLDRNTDDHLHFNKSIPALYASDHQNISQPKINIRECDKLIESTSLVTTKQNELKSMGSLFTLKLNSPVVNSNVLNSNTKKTPIEKCALRESMPSSISSSSENLEHKQSRPCENSSFAASDPCVKTENKYIGKKRDCVRSSEENISQFEEQEKLDCTSPSHKKSTNSIISHLTNDRDRASSEESSSLDDECPTPAKRKRISRKPATSSVIIESNQTSPLCRKPKKRPAETKSLTCSSQISSFNKTLGDKSSMDLTKKRTSPFKSSPSKRKRDLHRPRETKNNSRATSSQAKSSSGVAVVLGCSDRNSKEITSLEQNPVEADSLSNSTICKEPVNSPQKLMVVPNPTVNLQQNNVFKSPLKVKPTKKANPQITVGEVPKRKRSRKSVNKATRVCSSCDETTHCSCEVDRIIREFVDFPAVLSPLPNFEEETESVLENADKPTNDAAPSSVNTLEETPSVIDDGYVDKRATDVAPSCGNALRKTFSLVANEGDDKVEKLTNDDSNSANEVTQSKVPCEKVRNKMFSMNSLAHLQSFFNKKASVTEVPTTTPIKVPKTTPIEVAMTSPIEEPPVIRVSSRNEITDNATATDYLNEGLEKDNQNVEDTDSDSENEMIIDEDSTKPYSGMTVLPSPSQQTLPETSFNLLKSQENSRREEPSPIQQPKLNFYSQKVEVIETPHPAGPSIENNSNATSFPSESLPVQKSIPNFYRDGKEETEPSKNDDVNKKVVQFSSMKIKFKKTIAEEEIIPCSVNVYDFSVNYFVPISKTRVKKCFGVPSSKEKEKIRNCLKEYIQHPFQTTTLKKAKSTLANCNPLHFGKVLVEYLASLKEKGPNGVPSVNQKKAVLLVTTLGDRKLDYFDAVLKATEEYLTPFTYTCEFNTFRTEINSVSLFYALLCSSQGFNLRAQSFIYDVLYGRHISSFLIINNILSVMPKAIVYNRNPVGPLTYTIVYLIVKQGIYSSLDPNFLSKYGIHSLRNQLTKKYGYSFPDDVTRDAVVQELFANLHLKGTNKAIVLLCKCQGFKWTHSVVSKYVLPIIDEWTTSVENVEKNEDKVVHVVRILGLVSRGFALSLCQLFVTSSLDRLQNILNSKPSLLLAETTVEALFHFMRLDPSKVMAILNSFSPPDNLITLNSVKFVKKIEKMNNSSKWK